MNQIQAVVDELVRKAEREGKCLGCKKALDKEKMEQVKKSGKCTSVFYHLYCPDCRWRDLA